MKSERLWQQIRRNIKRTSKIVKGKGTQFDEKVVDAFVKAYPKINSVREELQG